MYNTKRYLLGLLLSSALLFVAQPASAVPISWNIDGTFDDGGVIIGNLVYDAGIFAAANWNLTVSNGNTAQFPVLTYTQTNSTFQTAGSVGSSELFEIDLGGTTDRFLIIGFQPNLTDAGGPVALLVSNGNTVEVSDNFSFSRNISGGTAVGTLASAPEPNAGTLLGLGLAAAFVWKRKAARNFLLRPFGK